MVPYRPPALALQGSLSVEDSKPRNVRSSDVRLSDSGMLHEALYGRKGKITINLDPSAGS